MEARAESECGHLMSWGLFEVKESGEKHIIGHASAYGFDVITQELAHVDFNAKSKTGIAVTKTGILYHLQGKPLKFGVKGHQQLREFVQVHNCNIRVLKV
ncbi:MAG: hypothetical protein HUJ23_08785 [Methylophaga sp.]|jgi:hypothetical protein|nr:hypothetical protein [Methylophaga sp.]MED5510278.1 hypothetical protein [Pseudomonadota bacterium]